MPPHGHDHPNSTPVRNPQPHARFREAFSPQIFPYGNGAAVPVWLDYFVPYLAQFWTIGPERMDMNPPKP
ncbi:hypothetical protein [Streptomyces sp. NWU339]|uniref:hypothetical protein n=1 Tax=Streptomyces sp. NWU339 TaxID=2185284 RepID=UPI0011B409DA|nr:hypothetical protein [Streptomyces sp. NWU339]